MDPLEAHQNPLGTVHGGIITTLLDSAMGCAVHTTLPPGGMYTTLELKVNFLRPSFGGGARLLAEGTVLNRGSTAVLVEATITDAQTRQEDRARDLDLPRALTPRLARPRPRPV